MAAPRDKKGLKQARLQRWSQKCSMAAGVIGLCAGQDGSPIIRQYTVTELVPQSGETGEGVLSRWAFLPTEAASVHVHGWGWLVDL